MIIALLWAMASVYAMQPTRFGAHEAWLSSMLRVMARYHLAQINVGRLRASINDPLVAEFVDALDRINALADAAPGFVWRLQTEEGNATGIQTSDDELFIINMSVWETSDDLFQYVYRTEHVDFLRNRREWFERMGDAHMCLWWVPADDIPSIDDGLERLDHFTRHGSTPNAFSFRDQFDPTGGKVSR